MFWNKSLIAWPMPQLTGMYCKICGCAVFAEVAAHLSFTHEVQQGRPCLCILNAETPLKAKLMICCQTLISAVGAAAIAGKCCPSSSLVALVCVVHRTSRMALAVWLTASFCSMQTLCSRHTVHCDHFQDDSSFHHGVYALHQAQPV